jgi:hypothetical protein
MNIKIIKNGELVNIAVFETLEIAQKMFPDCEFEIIENTIESQNIEEVLPIPKTIEQLQSELDELLTQARLKMEEINNL